MENTTGTVSERTMPKAAALPVVGSLPWLLVKPLRFLEETLARRGSVFELDLGVTRVVFVADVAAAEHVLLGNARNFDKAGAFWDGIRDVLGQGLGASEGALWRRQRKLIQPIFQRSFLERYRGTIAETIEDALGSLQSNGSIDVAPWCDRLERARRMFSERATALITERRLHPARGDDLLGVLVDATDELGSMSNQQLVDEAMTFYVAGYETTGATLAWILWLLASHPPVRDELQAELDRGSDDVPLLGACIQESLRLYPVAPFIIRYTLADDEIGGLRVSAGTPIVVSPWLIQRKPDLWPRPHEFDPRRFMDPALVAGRPRLAWIPFGAGQRICIGKALSTMELEESLRRILRRFTPAVAEDRPPPKPRLSTTMRSSTGIYLRMQPR
jgi:cytochrome P450